MKDEGDWRSYVELLNRPIEIIVTLLESGCVLVAKEYGGYFATYAFRLYSFL